MLELGMVSQSEINYLKEKYSNHQEKIAVLLFGPIVLGTNPYKKYEEFSKMIKEWGVFDENDHELIDKIIRKRIFN